MSGGVPGVAWRIDRQGMETGENEEEQRRGKKSQIHGGKKMAEKGTLSHLQTYAAFEMPLAQEKRS